MEILTHENSSFKIELMKQISPKFKGKFIIVQATNYFKVDLSSAIGYLLIHNLAM